MVDGECEVKHTESILYQTLKNNLPMLDLCRIESDMGDGIPDVNYTLGWIELKVTIGWAVGLRAAQVGWIRRRIRRGGIAFVSIWQKGSTRDNLWIVPGEMVELLSSEGLHGVENKSETGLWTGGPTSWDWSAIHKFLT